MQNRSPMRVSACLLGLAFAAAVAAQTTEKVVIDGSTGVAPLVEALARAYREQHPGTAIEIGKGLGTKARIQALREGRIDVAMASHGLNIAEVTMAIGFTNPSYFSKCFRKRFGKAPSDYKTTI